MRPQSPGSAAPRAESPDRGDAPKSPARPMSAEHKQALAAGREESRAVRRYLEALDAHRPTRGRRRSAESIARRIDAIDAQLASAEPAMKVVLVHERMDLYAQLKASRAREDLGELERGFVSAAGTYSARKGISYAAWREVGVPPEVLRRAGISRTS